MKLLNTSNIKFKKKKLFVTFVFLTTFVNFSFSQSTFNSNSIEFCGSNFVAPKNCEIIGTLIKCKDYVFTWSYEPINDLPRHQKEFLEQIENPKKINVLVKNTELEGYLFTIESYSSLMIIGNVDNKGVIINLFVNQSINTTSDLPDFVQQFITIIN